MGTCTCGHTPTAHEHYRGGTDCSLCGCSVYRRSWLRALRRLTRA